MIAPPVPLGGDHIVEDFSCGNEALDNWLKEKALAKEVSGASRTYVIAEGARVIGQYALANGGIAASDAPGKSAAICPIRIPS